MVSSNENNNNDNGPVEQDGLLIDTIVDNVFLGEINIAILGDANSGKTSFIKRISSGVYNNNYQSTGTHIITDCMMPLITNDNDMNGFITIKFHDGISNDF